MSDFVAGAAAGLVRLVAEPLLAGSRRRNADTRRQRREAGEDIASWMLELRNKLLRSPETVKAVEWVELRDRAYASFFRHLAQIPTGWRHLRRSLFDACGNGVGGINWLSVGPDYQIGDFFGRTCWSDWAGEYFEYAHGQVMHWQREYSNRCAAKVRLLNYDTWLRQTGRTDSPS